ncbi:MAG: hypothetical protein COS72_01225 [Candidatus Moranbacteria bacterium CG06_land_8_20_14_3_00_43_56]|nr:MAG: hypothetical protein COS72_01225 [Candidatus Moranbacteria bacterium CG06_land_8_20_14_3_00_43_56]
MRSPESQFNTPINPSEKLTETPKVEAGKGPEQEMKIEPRDMIGERAENLKNFQPTGDRQKDIESFLTMTGRESYLEAIRSGRVDAATVLSEIRDFQSQSLDPESKFHHELDESDPKFAKKNQFYREIPAHEIKTIDGILKGEAKEEAEQERKFDEEPKEGEQKQEQEEREESPENQEKRERMKQISERVEQGFDSAKERMMSLEQRYDQIFGTAQEKFSKLSERFPNIITSEFLDRMDQKNERVKNAYANMFVIYNSGNERMQTMIQSLPVEFLSMEQINSIDRSVDKIFETIDRGEEKIQEKLDYLESTVDRVPDMREAVRKPKEVEEAKEKIEESELIGKKPEDEIELNQ